MDNIRALEIEAEAARTLMLNLQDVFASDDDEQAREDVIEGETGLKEIIADAIDMLTELETLAEAVGKRIEDMRARKTRMEARVDLIRAAVASAMGVAGLRKLTLPTATLSLKPTPPKVVVNDESEIPSVFWSPQPPKLDKGALLKALKEGPVEGSSLSNGGETLAVRVR